MDDFPISWLDLREGADHAARDPGLLAAAAAIVDAADDPLVVDLGCGTGSTLRALGPTTLLQLPGAGTDALRAMGDLVRSVPCFALRLGPDADAIPGAVARLLAP